MVGIRNFQVCARCRNHGIRVILKGHKRSCTFKQCSCDKCLVTRDRQSFIAKEIAMHRYEVKSRSGSDEGTGDRLKLNLVRRKIVDERSSSSNESMLSGKSRRSRVSGEVRKDQMCSRCRNHGIVQLLRGHKNACEFVSCLCPKCEITKKRREIMARQIKDYRNVKVSESSTASSPELEKHFEIMADTNSYPAEQFINYEPMENRDLFFMIQSLYEKYGSVSAEKRIQLIYAFASLANGHWGAIEKSLEKGETMFKY